MTGGSRIIPCFSVKGGLLNMSHDQRFLAALPIYSLAKRSIHTSVLSRTVYIPTADSTQFFP